MLPFNRRQLFQYGGSGLGSLALSSLLHCETLAAKERTDFTPRVKRVIWLFMHGGPSHVDLFDPKPELSRLAGQPVPSSFGEVMTRRKVAQNPLLPAIKPFRQRGNRGWRLAISSPTLQTLQMICASFAACMVIA